MKNKRGQLKISFGMIFSIILIIIFISFAIYGITKFLNLQKNIQVNKFADDLQYDVDQMWRSNQGAQDLEYLLPSKIDKVYFLSENVGDNVELRSAGHLIGSYKIEHLDILETFYVTNTNGKIKISLKKEFGEPLVRINEA